MAKAGFWLRGSRGKLAGASMGKGQNGQTIIREIVTPKNPRSNGQLYQRAIMATVMQAYSKGKAIFDHSFEGMSVGAQCMQTFLKLNAKALRTAIATDIANNTLTKDAKGRVVAPGSSIPVQNEYVISSGSYENKFMNGWINEEEFDMGVKFPAPLENDTVANYAARNGLIPDDIYTIVIFGTTDTEALHNDLGKLASISNCGFGFQRLQVKADVQTNTATLANFGQLFEHTESSGYPIGGSGGIESLTLTANTNWFSITDFFGSAGWIVGSIGVIRSRLDEDLRSNTIMVSYPSTYGITAPYILPVWKAGTQQLGSSELILEGGDD